MQRPSQRQDLLWQTIIGFVGFFTLLAFVQAAINITKPEPSIWPGLVLAAFVAALWWLIRRWRQWRAGKD